MGITLSYELSKNMISNEKNRVEKMAVLENAIIFSNYLQHKLNFE